MRMCTRMCLAPSLAAPLMKPMSWLQRLCTPPSDSRPMKCRVLLGKASEIYFQPSSLKADPSSSAMSTRRAP